MNLQGYSAVIAEESVEYIIGSVLRFDKIEATTASFYQSTSSDGLSFKGEYLKKDVDYLIINENEISLVNTPTSGSVILARQMDPTGQIIPVSEGSSTLFVFNDIASVVESNLQDGDAITINGGGTPGDRLGGNKYLTVLL